MDADRWLASVEQDMVQGDWTYPDAGRIPLGEYAARWVEERPGQRPKSQQLYEGLVRLHIRPGVGAYDLVSVTLARVGRGGQASSRVGLVPRRWPRRIASCAIMGTTSKTD